MRNQWRQALQLFCVTGALLADKTVAHADFDLRQLWSASEAYTSQDTSGTRAPLDWLSGGFNFEQALYFGGIDMQRYGFGAYVGTVWSPSPNRDGLLFRLFASDGIDSFRTPKTTFSSHTMRAAFTPGYRISRSGFELSAYAGVDVLARANLPINKTTRLQPDFGMRLLADFWWEPRNAMMIAANLSMTTIEASFYGRLAAGIKIFDIWTGPGNLCEQRHLQPAISHRRPCHRLASGPLRILDGRRLCVRQFRAQQRLRPLRHHIARIRSHDDHAVNVASVSLSRRRPRHG